MVCAVGGVALGAFLLGLPLLGGVTAFLATTSIATAGLATAYATPILLRLTLAQHFEPGPYNLGRSAGLPEGSLLSCNSTVAA